MSFNGIKCRSRSNSRSSKLILYWIYQRKQVQVKLNDGQTLNLIKGNRSARRTVYYIKTLPKKRKRIESSGEEQKNQY